MGVCVSFGDYHMNKTYPGATAYKVVTDDGGACLLNIYQDGKILPVATYNHWDRVEVTP